MHLSREIYNFLICLILNNRTNNVAYHYGSSGI